jgi:hypothetical protein
MPIRRPLHLLALLAVVAGACLAIAVGGCGGGSDPTASTDPEFTVPSTPTVATTNTATTPTVTTPTDTTPTDDSGQTTTPDASGNGGTTVPNGGSSGGTPSGTTTISPDEAAQNFEKYCREHPEACGE